MPRTIAGRESGWRVDGVASKANAVVRVSHSSSRANRVIVDGATPARYATQRDLCRRFAASVINAVACQDITLSHTQKIVNAAPTAGEGNRVHRMLSAMVSAGLKGGYLVNPMLAQATGRPGTARCRPRRSRWRESRRCWSTPPRSLPPTT